MWCRCVWAGDECRGVLSVVSCVWAGDECRGVLIECGVGVYGLGMSEEVSECGVRCVWPGDECGGV